MKNIKIYAVLFCIIFASHAAFAAPGDLDAAFGNGGKVTTPFGELAYRGRAVLVQNDGKIVIAGQTYSNSTYDFAVARYNTDGSADLSFGAGGAVITPIGISSDYVTGAALQADGKIVVVGTIWTGLEQFGVARYNTDGSLDATFGGTGKIITDMIDNVGYDSPSAVRVQTDGRILVSGTCSNKICLARYNTNGSLDSSFDADGKLIVSPNNVLEQEAAAALDLQNDGKILVAGNIRFDNGNNDFLIVRINQNGTIDTTFGNGGRAITPVSVSTDYASAIAVAPNGKIVVAGNSYRIGSPMTRPNVYTDYDAAVVRYLPNGLLDASFDGDGVATARFGDDRDLFDDFITAVSVQQNGKVLIAGYSWNGSRFNMTLARFNGAGALDADFGNNGKVITTIGVFEDKAYSMALQKDGRIIVGGESHLGSTLSFTVARYHGDAIETVHKNPFDYDGDGKSDISVFRPSSNIWYVNRSTQGFFAAQFGATGDLLAPADFDGDGKTDLAVFRPSNGTWYWINSSNGTLSGAGFGSNGDIPAPADYDGDGKADLAVFRPSNGTWYRTNSSNSAFVAVQFGASGDQPTIGDFDGDGKADIAVFRPSNSIWYRLNSGSNNAFYAVQFGIAGDKPVPADYDGDGKTDVAVFRASNNIWYRLNSGSNDSLSGVGFGIAGDKPAPADYDGDGKADFAVFRPSNSTWYLQMSSAGFAAAQFGASEDSPTPAAFVR